MVEVREAPPGKATGRTGRPGAARAGGTTRGVLLGWALALLSPACGAEHADEAPHRPPPSARSDAGSEEPLPGIITRIREDFDNHRMIEATSGVVLDVNHGKLTLPAVQIPATAGKGLDHLEGTQERNGLLESGSILVPEQALLIASDSVELRAHDVVRVAGEIRAGRGGLTIVAERSIIIEGAIDSRGPVRLLLASPEGEIRISGQVTGRSSADAREPAHVEVFSRGSVQITGALTTAAEQNRRGGDLTISSYGPVLVSGSDARVAANAERAGSAGVVRIRSEADVVVEREAVVGSGYAAFGIATDLPIGGDVEVQGRRVVVRDAAKLSAGAWPERGGSIYVLAHEEVRLEDQGVLRAGHGAQSGAVVVRAPQIVVGREAVIEGGVGGAGAGAVTLEAVDALALGRDARILGGDTDCGPGGSVRLAVGGLLEVAPGARVVGGEGSRLLGNVSCSRGAAGGDVRVQARSATGLEEAVAAGRGVRSGEVEIALAPDFSVPPPNLTVGTSGFVRSKILDRGAEAVGATPRLEVFAGESPDGTTIVLELSGASSPEGPFGEWLDARRDLDDLSGAQFFRYRVRLVGRALDAPVVDFFEIELAAP